MFPALPRERKSVQQTSCLATATHARLVATFYSSNETLYTLKHVCMSFVKSPKAKKVLHWIVTLEFFSKKT